MSATKVKASKVQDLFSLFARNVMSLPTTLNVSGQLLQGRRNNVVIGDTAYVDTDWSASIAKRKKSAKKFIVALAGGDATYDAMRVRVLSAILEQTSRELSKRAFYTLCAFESAEAIVAFIKTNNIKFPDGVDTQVYWESMFKSVVELARARGYSNVRDIFEKGKVESEGDLADFNELLEGDYTPAAATNTDYGTAPLDKRMQDEGDADHDI